MTKNEAAKIGICEKSCNSNFDFFLSEKKKASGHHPEAVFREGEGLYSLTNFKVLTASADFTVTKYMPLFKPSRLRVVNPLAWLC